MSASLRQRQRHGIVLAEAHERRQTKRISSSLQKTSLFGKLCVCVVLMLLVAALVVLQVVRPNILPWNKPTLHLASIYPPPIWLDGIPHYILASPDNVQLIDALRYSIQQRAILQQSRILRVNWEFWEDGHLQEFHKCGDMPNNTWRHDFSQWCRLAHGQVDGIVEYGLVFERSFSKLYQTLAVRVVGKDQILSSLIICTAPSSTVTSQMVTWLQQEQSSKEAMERHLFQLIQQDQVEWTLLDAICDNHSLYDTTKRRKLASICRDSKCCEIYEPVAIRKRVMHQNESLTREFLRKT